MGASNFTKVNAKNYYVIGEDWECYDFDFFRATFPDTVKTAFENETFDYECEDCLPVQGWRTRKWDDRSYYGTLLSSAKIYPGDFSLPNKDVTLNPIGIIVNIYAIAGYYQGATLDWDLGFVYAGINEYRKDFVTEYESKDDLFEDVADSYFDELEYFRKYKATPEDRKKLIKYLSDAFAKYAEMADKICESNCEETLKLVAHFSNGEAVYE